MCGIAGIVAGRTGVTRAGIERFTRAIAHRGPDGEGYWLDAGDGIALGHRRLSILGLGPQGAQPMHLGERYVMSYNGEVYNFLELREELRGLGHHFATETDSEVVLTAYAQWGEACLHRFNGMWAVAVYDRHTRELWLARDRYGIKPLYYLYDENVGLAFASETIAFRHLEGYTRTFAAAPLNRCLANVTSLEASGETIFTGVRQLRAGHTLTYRAGGPCREARWWRQEDHRATREATPALRTEQWRDVFDSACRLRLRSDVPVASAVSGGLDSSSVYATLQVLASGSREARSAERWQRAYVLSMPGSARDETAFAKAVTDAAGHELQRVEVAYGDVQQLEARTRLYDGLFHNPNFVLHDLYGAMARDGIKVSLDGHGADELMYGYPVMIQRALRLARTADRRRYANFSLTLAAMRAATPATPPPPPRLLGRVRGALASVLRQLGPRLEASAYDAIRTSYFAGGTLEAILRNFDRASMAVGVEIRMPFLDHRVVAQTLALDVDDHVRAPYAKATLRAAMRERLPRSIVERRDKIGIMAPLDELFGGQLKSWLLDTVRSGAFLDSPHWDGRRLAGEVESRALNDDWTLGRGMKLWPYLNAHLLDVA